ncbi:MAG TPA: glycosyltransferase [Vicinamibacterales bacterium]|nr:glycosyltransferase [Vicinamibacterales bacterium]
MIVPTFNRAASLDALVRALRQQTGGTPFEIIVVDNRSSDRTRDVVAFHAGEDRRIRYVFEPRAGASCARNAGIAVARGAILAFIDDDIRPREDWVASIARAFAEHPEVDCIGGRVEPRWPSMPPAWLTPQHWPPLALQTRRGDSPYLDRDHASACLITANFACRAEVIRDVGGFAPEYLRDEDREFNLRMWRAGKRGMYADTVVAFAEIQPERLDKRYHRQWYHVTGASHARLRYRDTIDRDGRLVPDLTARGLSWLGVPGFLYREFLAHLWSWTRRSISGQWDAAFGDECRIRYLASYFFTRWRQSLSATGNDAVVRYSIAQRRRASSETKA